MATDSMVLLFCLVLEVGRVSRESVTPFGPFGLRTVQKISIRPKKKIPKLVQTRFMM